MGKVRLVEITKDDRGWKGTWYRKGQRHFVQQQPGWPEVYTTRWHARTPGTWGGIGEANCRVLHGPLVWLRCLWFRLTARNASWSR
jgi:hypothetical protein